MVKNSNWLWLRRALRLIIIEFAVLFASSLFFKDILGIHRDLNLVIMEVTPICIWLFFLVLFSVFLPSFTKKDSPIIKQVLNSIVYFILYGVIFFFTWDILDSSYILSLSFIVFFGQVATCLIVSKLLFLTLFYIIFRNDIPWKNLKLILKNLRFWTALGVMMLFWLVTFLESRWYCFYWKKYKNSGTMGMNCWNLYTMYRCRYMKWEAIETKPCWLMSWEELVEMETKGWFEEFWKHKNSVPLSAFEDVVLVAVIFLFLLSFSNTLWSKNNLSSPNDDENTTNNLS